MLRDKLSDKEKDMIEHYIDAYIEDGASRTVDADYILRAWDNAKENLYKMLGNQMIVSRPVSFKMGVEEIMDDLDNRLRLNTLANQFRDKWSDFFHWAHRRWNDWGYTEEPATQPWHNDYELSSRLREMINLDNLATNVWNSDPFEVPFPDGTVFKVQRGAKLTKAMGKIVKAYSDALSKEEFEAFRIVCSQALNQKELRGTLTLSIHPLDYMTMSDNENRWSSCMSWSDGGCYRQGTVEMMNSPMVVVAYLADDNAKLHMPGGYEWNSKKWRELIVVNADVITHILGYPYRNEYLSRAAIDMVKELAEKNCGWPYINENPITFENDRPFMYEGEKHEIIFHTNNMYNDFNNRSYNHQAYLGHWVENNYDLRHTYSGDSECMACGELNPGFDGEGCLAGECCWQEDNSEYCDYCEESYHGDSHYVDGMYLCDDCYDEHVIRTVDGEDHLEDNCIKVRFLDDDHHDGWLNLWFYDDGDLRDVVGQYFTKVYRLDEWHETKYYFTYDSLTKDGLEALHRESGDCLDRTSEETFRHYFCNSSYGRIKLEDLEEINFEE